MATVYFEFDWPVQVWNATFGRLLAIIRAAISGNKKTQDATDKDPKQHSGKQSEDVDSEKQVTVFVSTFGTKLMTAGLLLISFQQILYPLRHHLYPGDVTWNELGHRYSWRMKLRDKVRLNWIDHFISLNFLLPRLGP